MNEQAYDVIILGAGPAGLQAAIHAVRRKVSVLVLGKLRKSSTFKAHIENYCCVHGDTGADLLKGGYEKAVSAGVEFREEDVTALTEKDGAFALALEGGRTVTGRAVILAMGISRNKLGLSRESEFIGRGVSYCVDCDAGFYRDQTVAVIGCESAAVSSALTLLLYAKSVHLVCERLDVAAELADKMRQSDIVFHEGRRVTEIVADKAVQGIVLDDGIRIEVTGMFIVLGAKGAVDLAAELGVALDAETMKYIATNKKQETNIAGLYAAGDICGPPWQVAKAVGEGCVAGLEAAAYAKRMKGA